MEDESLLALSYEVPAMALLSGSEAGNVLEIGVSQGERKPRIAQPPYLSLGEAIRVADQIYEQGGGNADANLLTSVLKNSINSSSFTRKLQALRVYKLTGGMIPPVSLTEIGLAIVAPKDDFAKAHALTIAAVGPEPFRKAYERLRGKLLPQDEYLRNTFQHEMQLPRVVADAWADSFKAALETANLLLERPDGKTQILEAPSGVPVTPVEQISEVREITPPSVRTSTPDRIERAILESEDGHSSKIALADGRFATFFIPDRLTRRDGTRLKGALTGIAAIIESMIEEPAE